MNRPVRLLTVGRPLRVIVCPLCAALVVADGDRQHDAVHVATLRNATEPVAERHDVDTTPEVVVDLAAIEDDDEYLTDLGDGAPADPDDVVGQHLAAFRDEVDGEDLR